MLDVSRKPQILMLHMIYYKLNLFLCATQRKSTKLKFLIIIKIH
jgi:hypothetical protein